VIIYKISKQIFYLNQVINLYILIWLKLSKPTSKFLRFLNKELDIKMDKLSGTCYAHT